MIQLKRIAGLALVLGASLSHAGTFPLVSGLYENGSGCDVFIQNDPSGLLRFEISGLDHHMGLKNQASLELNLGKQKARRFFACSQINQSSLYFQTERSEHATQYTVMCNSEESDSKMVMSVDTESQRLMSISLVESRYLDWVQVQTLNLNCEKLSWVRGF